MEDLRRLIVVRQDDRVAGFLQFVDRLDIGRHERPLDRRDHVLDPLIEMRGGALDLGRPFQRRHGQRAGAPGWTNAGARWDDGTPVREISKIVGTVDYSDRHVGLLPYLLLVRIFTS